MLISSKRMCDEHRGYILPLVFSLHRNLGRHMVDFFDIPDKVRMPVLDLVQVFGKLTRDSNIEVDVGIMCACMPFLPALIKDWSIPVHIELPMTSIHSKLFIRHSRNHEPSFGSGLADDVNELPLQNYEHFA